MFEVNINVGRLITFLRDKSLNQHYHAARIDLGNAEAEAHRRVRRRTATLAQDVLRACKRDDVVHGQKIRFVVELRDELELMFDKCDDFLRNTIGPSAPHTLLGELP